MGQVDVMQLAARHEVKFFHNNHLAACAHSTKVCPPTPISERMRQKGSVVGCRGGGCSSVTAKATHYMHAAIASTSRSGGGTEPATHHLAHIVAHSERVNFLPCLKR
jgi:hypothetical protein